MQAHLDQVWRVVVDVRQGKAEGDGRSEPVSSVVPGQDREVPHLPTPGALIPVQRLEKGQGRSVVGCCGSPAGLGIGVVTGQTEFGEVQFFSASSVFQWRAGLNTIIVRLYIDGQWPLWIGYLSDYKGSYSSPDRLHKTGRLRWPLRIRSGTSTARV